MTTASLSPEVSSTSDEGSVPKPSNGLVTALLTDLYQITMVYAHWKNNRHEDNAVFELFFRKNPFGGEYTIFAGMDEVLKFLAHYKFLPEDVSYLQQDVPALRQCDPAFFDWLLKLDTSRLTVRALPDGTVAFPRVPLVTVEGPLGIAQLIETTLLTLVNYPSLVATNAARMVLAASSSSTTSLLAASRAPGISWSQRSSVSQADLRDSTSSMGECKPAQCFVSPSCVEFGLRRAQGPDGGFSASKYSAMGGFVATSNVQAGKFCSLNVSGTHAHAFVQSYSSLSEVEAVTVALNHQNQSSDDNDNTAYDKINNYQLPQQHTVIPQEVVLLLPLVLKHRENQGKKDSRYFKTNEGELAAFVAYASAFPHAFLCLIDTYDTLASGLLNFIVVALALYEIGYIAKGIRLDSGDLAYLSLECAKAFHDMAQVDGFCDHVDGIDDKDHAKDSEKHRENYVDTGSVNKIKHRNSRRDFFTKLSIVASNDINEDVLHALSKQEHAITVFGIGTNLVTCQAQPALGCVYKLVEISGRPRMKLSQDVSKVLIPSRKQTYRLYGKDGRPILDLMLAIHETPPLPGQRILCLHPFVGRKRAAVTPTIVEKLDQVVFQNGVVIPGANRTSLDAREHVLEELSRLRPDILRYVNPTPYKVSVSETLFNLLHELWQTETPVPELS